MAFIQIFIVAACASLVLGQRPFFAGSRPIGFPELETTSSASGLGNRFGDGTTQRLPIEALGDQALVDRLSKLPVDKQPFWFINWQAIEAIRQKPQTYPLRPNPFAESSQPNTGFDNNAGVNTNAGATHVNSLPNDDLGNRSGDSNASDNNENSKDSSLLPSSSTSGLVTKTFYDRTVYSSNNTVIGPGVPPLY